MGTAEKVIFPESGAATMTVGSTASKIKEKRHEDKNLHLNIDNRYALIRINHSKNSNSFQSLSEIVSLSAKVRDLETA